MLCSFVEERPVLLLAAMVLLDARVVKAVADLERDVANELSSEGEEDDGVANPNAHGIAIRQWKNVDFIVIIFDLPP